MDTKTTIVKPEMFEIKKRPSVVEKKMGATPQNTWHLAVNLGRPPENHVVHGLLPEPSQNSVFNSRFSWTLTVCWVSYEHFSCTTLFILIKTHLTDEGTEA